jgi:hypothetical protein
MLNKYLPATFCGRINGDAVAIRFLRDNIVQLYKNEIHHESTTFYFDNDLLFLHTTNGLLGKLTRDVRFFEQKNILFLKGPKAYLTDSNCYPSSYSLTPKINYKDYSFEDFFILELNNLSYLKRQLGQNE